MSFPELHTAMMSEATLEGSSEGAHVFEGRRYDGTEPTSRTGR